MNSRQQEILKLLNQQPELGTRDIQSAMDLTRARVHQLIVPLLKKGLVKKEGRARATVYKLSDKRSIEQITRENWELRRKVLELQKSLDDRKVI